MQRPAGKARESVSQAAFRVFSAESGLCCLIAATASLMSFRVSALVAVAFWRNARERRRNASTLFVVYGPLSMFIGMINRLCVRSEDTIHIGLKPVHRTAARSHSHGVPRIETLRAHLCVGHSGVKMRSNL